MLTYTETLEVTTGKFNTVGPLICENYTKK
jgi:hypothetical protein